MPNGDASFDANELPEAIHMEDDIWADRAFYDDGDVRLFVAVGNGGQDT